MVYSKFVFSTVKKFLRMDMKPLPQMPETTAPPTKSQLASLSRNLLECIAEKSIGFPPFLASPDSFCTQTRSKQGQD